MNYSTEQHSLNRIRTGVFAHFNSGYSDAQTAQGRCEQILSVMKTNVLVLGFGPVLYLNPSP